MKYRFLILCLAFFCAFFSASNYVLKAEDTPEQLQQKINERAELIKKLDAEIKTYADLADKTSKQAQSLGTYIKTLDSQYKALDSDVKKSQTSIDKTSLEIRKISNAIVGNEEKIGRLTSGMRESLVNQYKLDGVSVVENFLADRNIMASIKEIETLIMIQDKISGSVKDITVVKKNLEVDKTEGQLKKEELEKQKKELTTKQTSLSIVKEEQKKELAITKNQESTYNKVLAERKVQKAAFEKEMFEYENKLKYVLNPGSIPKANSSPLGWPLSNVIITQQFGVTGASARLYASGSHNGTDFGAKVGTPVLAMADGVLVAQGDTDLNCRGVSFGRWILIKYSNGLASTYGHLSKYDIVPTGSAVKAGDIVGYSGNTGYTTGPHLHVSLYPADAVNAISRPSASCPGRSMTMPVAAVSAYLDPLAYMPRR